MPQPKKNFDTLNDAIRDGTHSFEELDIAYLGNLATTTLFQKAMFLSSSFFLLTKLLWLIQPTSGLELPFFVNVVGKLRLLFTITVTDTRT